MHVIIVIERLHMAVMFEDQLVPDKTQFQTLPTNWVDQCQCVQTSELLQWSEECKVCSKMTMDWSPLLWLLIRILYLDLSNYCTFAHLFRFLALKNDQLSLSATKFNLYVYLEHVRPGPFN